MSRVADTAVAVVIAAAAVAIAVASAITSAVATVAIAGMVLGGLGNVWGAVIGGLMGGIIEVFSIYIVGADFVKVPIWGLLLIILVFKPTGLFGHSAIGKGKF